jgi:hypothetical protein
MDPPQSAPQLQIAARTRYTDCEVLAAEVNNGAGGLGARMDLPSEALVDAPAGAALTRRTK